jgi:hypothetical protein
MDCSICVHKIKLMIFEISKQLTSNIQAAQTILKRGLEVFGLGTSLCTLAKAKSKSLLIAEA